MIKHDCASQKDLFKLKSSVTTMTSPLQAIKGSNELMLLFIELLIGPGCTETSSTTSLHVTLARESRPANNHLLVCSNPFPSLLDLGKSSQWTLLLSYPLPSMGMMRFSL